MIIAKYSPIGFDVIFPMQSSEFTKSVNFVINSKKNLQKDCVNIFDTNQNCVQIYRLSLIVSEE